MPIKGPLPGGDPAIPAWSLTHSQWCFIPVSLLEEAFKYSSQHTVAQVLVDINIFTVVFAQRFSVSQQKTLSCSKVTVAHLVAVARAVYFVVVL